LIQRLRPQKCTECGKVCTSVGRLNSHKTERLHKCRECPKDFKSPWELDQHIMVHTGERPHDCHVPECDGKFKTAKGLAAHAAFRTTDTAAENFQDSQGGG
jgi:KRAB domain-containing zinc finger protein